jgi:hypothetical protein
MAQAFFRFYAELNFFLPHDQRQVTISHPVANRASVKDMIEAFGVPHTEIDLILVNVESVDFSYRVKDGTDQRTRSRILSGHHAAGSCPAQTLREPALFSTSIWGGWQPICGCWGSTRCTRPVRR